MKVITVGDRAVCKMKLTEYRDAAKKTAGNCTNIYLALGMVGESGEVIDVLKKIVRDANNGKNLADSLAERKPKLKDELGDVLWYWAIYFEDQIVDNVEFAIEPEVDIVSALNCSLSLAMTATEFAMLTLNNEAPKTDAAMFTILQNVCDVCQAVGLDIYEVMQSNIEKLASRYEEGFKLGVK
jgi:hypothetical protein